MAPLPSCPPGRRGDHRIREGVGETVSTCGVPRLWPGQVVRSALALVALLTLAAWWDRDPATSTDNVIGNHPGTLSAIALSPDGRWLASGGHRGAVLIWDLARRELEAELDPSESPVSGLA